MQKSGLSIGNIRNISSDTKIKYIPNEFLDELIGKEDLSYENENIKDNFGVKGKLILKRDKLDYFENISVEKLNFGGDFNVFLVNIPGDGKNQDHFFIGSPVGNNKKVIISSKDTGIVKINNSILENDTPIKLGSVINNNINDKIDSDILKLLKIYFIKNKDEDIEDLQYEKIKTESRTMIKDDLNNEKIDFSVSTFPTFNNNHIIVSSKKLNTKLIGVYQDKSTVLLNSIKILNDKIVGNILIGGNTNIIFGNNVIGDFGDFKVSCKGDPMIIGDEIFINSKITYSKISKMVTGPYSVGYNFTFKVNSEGEVSEIENGDWKIHNLTNADYAIGEIFSFNIENIDQVKIGGDIYGFGTITTRGNTKNQDRISENLKRCIFKITKEGFNIIPALMFDGQEYSITSIEKDNNRGAQKIEHKNTFYVKLNLKDPLGDISNLTNSGKDGYTGYTDKYLLDNNQKGVKKYFVEGKFNLETGLFEDTDVSGGRYTLINEQI